MKLISKDAAIAAIGIVLDEAKPLNGYSLPALIQGVADRYQMAKVPTIQETTATGAKFNNGRLAAKNINVTELSIHSNSIGVTTTDTKDSELVLNDLMGWLRETFGFREFATKPVKVFQSDLIVELDNDPTQTLKLFAPLLDLLDRGAESINGIKKSVHFNRIDFGSDPLSAGPNVVFLIERRAGIPYASNRYFCKAYMQTDAHIGALELMDKLLGKAKR